MSITVSEASENLLALIAGVNNGGNVVLIARKGGNAVLISEREYRSLVEMQYLCSTPANGKWLSKSMEQAQKGEVLPLGDYFGQKR